MLSLLGLVAARLCLFDVKLSLFFSPHSSSHFLAQFEWNGTSESSSAVLSALLSKAGLPPSHTHTQLSLILLHLSPSAQPLQFTSPPRGMLYCSEVALSYLRRLKGARSKFTFGIPQCRWWLMPHLSLLLFREHKKSSGLLVFSQSETLCLGVNLHIWHQVNWHVFGGRQGWS